MDTGLVNTGQLSRDREPIAALASGGGASALAVLRLTGDGVFALSESCLKPQGDKPWEPRRMRLCRFTDPVTGERLDDPLVVRFHGPRSFTGQDLVEIHAHGGPYVVRRLLSALFAHGFRPADPGEFTRRAFLNGKMDLTEAEGIGAMVAAESRQQWIAARHLVSGTLRDHIDSLRTTLVECMAYLEAQIDFPDEGDTAHLHREHVRTRARQVEQAIARLAGTYDAGKVARDGLLVALFGPPNAGKSTLMNALLGEERAIVTDIPGTTRDYLEERCLIDGRLIRLVDMAGVRDASAADAVERIGIERALKLAREADVVLSLAPADAPASDIAALTEQLAALEPRRIRTLMTKSDLLSGTEPPGWASDRLAISCKSGTGLGELKAFLVQAVEEHVSSLGEAPFVTSARHLAALEDARTFVDAFFAADEAGEFDECLAFELQHAARALTRIIGDVDVEDVLDAIFKNFCVGK